MSESAKVQLEMPAAVLEHLLQTRALHLEHVHSLDVQSHRTVQELVKKSLMPRRKQG